MARMYPQEMGGYEKATAVEKTVLCFFKETVGPLTIVFST